MPLWFWWNKSDENKDIFSSTKTLVIYEKFIVQAKLGLCQSSIPGPPMYHVLSLGSSVVDPHFATEHSVISLHLGETYSNKKARK